MISSEKKEFPEKRMSPEEGGLSRAGEDAAAGTDKNIAGKTEDDIVVRTESLTKIYGDLTAVDHLDLQIRRGEVFGLLGPNGAGKTTTTLMLLGLTEPDAGKATIHGLDCTRNALQVKKAVGYLPDNVGFYGTMTGRENLRFMGRINGLEGKALEERIDRLLERVGMAQAADKKTGTSPLWG